LPDVNPIEEVWNKIKDYIELNYPDLTGRRQYTYDQIREIA
jgi:hypothetical protein